MSTARKQFWKYAREAIFSACDAETERDRRDFLELARTWTQAALVERRSLAGRDTTVSAA
jgi:hypothetical protein